MKEDKYQLMKSNNTSVEVSEKNVSNVNTPYDDVFRTLMNDCQRFLIPLVNEVFKKDYSPDEEVVLESNEHFITQQGGKQDKVISDSNVRIGKDLYQIECQSTIDGSMIIRVWEYGSQIALRHAQYDGDQGTLRLKFPNTAVVYLRHNATTPDYTTIHIEVPGDSCEYKVLNIKLDEYSVDDIFEKRLYFFIPFQLFLYEKNFKRYDSDFESFSELLDMVASLFTRVNECASSEISEYEKGTLRDLFKKVSDNLCNKHSNIKKGIGDVMGGKILNYRTKEIWNRAKAEVLVQAIENMIKEFKCSLTKACEIMETTSEKYYEAKDLLSTKMSEDEW